MPKLIRLSIDGSTIRRGTIESPHSDSSDEETTDDSVLSAEDRTEGLERAKAFKSRHDRLFRGLAGK